MNKLFIIAIIGSILGYFIINTFIIEISFIKYFGIELVITLMHELYNCARRAELKHIKSK